MCDVILRLASITKAFACDTEAIRKLSDSVKELTDPHGRLNLKSLLLRISLIFQPLLCLGAVVQVAFDEPWRCFRLL